MSACVAQPIFLAEVGPLLGVVMRQAHVWLASQLVGQGVHQDTTGALAPQDCSHTHALRGFAGFHSDRLLPEVVFELFGLFPGPGVALDCPGLGCADEQARNADHCPVSIPCETTARHPSFMPICLLHFAHACMCGRICMWL